MCGLRFEAFRFWLKTRSFEARWRIMLRSILRAGVMRLHYAGLYLWAIRTVAAVATSTAASAPPALTRFAVRTKLFALKRRLTAWGFLRRNKTLALGEGFATAFFLHSQCRCLLLARLAVSTTTASAASAPTPASSSATFTAAVTRLFGPLLRPAICLFMSFFMCLDVGFNLVLFADLRRDRIR